MNHVAAEIRSYIGLSDDTKSLMDEYWNAFMGNDSMAHVGVGHLDGGESGRYPWGSGKQPFQHSYDFLKRYKELMSELGSEVAVAEALGFKNTTEMRPQVMAASHIEKLSQASRAKQLVDSGMTNTEAAKKLGVSPNSVANMIKENYGDNFKKGQNTADLLEKEIKSGKRMIDVGRLVAETQLGIAQPTMDEALFLLQQKGYHVYNARVQQPTNPDPNKKTTIRVLADKDVEYREAYQNTDQIRQVTEYVSDDAGETFRPLQYPTSISSDRVYVNYADTGTGLQKDGVIEIRRGVPDLSLGNDNYSQVRILVDDNKYLKGMAMYSNDIPDGYDIVFNTNKNSNKSKAEVFKNIERDEFQPNNPFGAAIKAKGQSEYLGDDGKMHLSAINKIKEEGDWEEMSKNLSAQFLAKQPIKLIDHQLKLTYDDALDEFKSIMELDNPVVKQQLLEEFATTCTSSARNLKAIAFPRQTTQVILPMPFLKDDEVYAPNYENGEKLILIRYPHGGVFEIPTLTVNNKNKKARETLDPNATDAIGINNTVAERLSGADFDGDQVVAIPVGNIKFKTSEPLKDLVGFDPKTAYSTDGMTAEQKKKLGLITTDRERNKQMGMASNLVNDMTLQNANEDEIVRAVKYSMVVIDAKKHELNWRAARQDYNIKDLQKRYQIHILEDGTVKYGGAATLLSRKNQDVRVPERQGSGWIDENGERHYKESGRTYIDKKGNEVQATTKAKLLDVTDDLHTLSSGTEQEKLYANFGNKMKALGREALKESHNIKTVPKDLDAAQEYYDEVQSLKAKVANAEANVPRERYATIVADSRVKAMKNANKDANGKVTLDSKYLRKASNYIMQDARVQVGASSKDVKIELSDREWEAIQKNAVSKTFLKKVLKYSDMDLIKERATPRPKGVLTDTQKSIIRRMLRNGYTNAEIASRLGVSASTISKYKKEL